jgi:2-polyprenyl-3-methyl-5-hydroxy-6-metoxy-1,4-benzoquinol methylase
MEIINQSTEISSRFWNLPQKPLEEVNRESIFIDDIIQKAHIEKEILSHLNGIHTIFDGGAGYGRFSILLAKRGFQVTHFDISEPMIEKAKEFAQKEGVLGNMTFIKGSLEQIDFLKDRQFDMVLSFDAPVSYTYPTHENVIKNLIRICSKRLIISVYSRLAWTEHLFDPGQKFKYILDKNTNDPFARWIIDHEIQKVPEHYPDMKTVEIFFKTGLMENPEETLATFKNGGTPWPVSYAFMPDELLNILKIHGTKNIKLSGPGALSRSIPGEILKNIMHNEKLKNDFLDFCYRYDSQLWCAGMGKDNLVANAEI